MTKALKYILIIGVFLRLVLWGFQSDAMGDDGNRYCNEAYHLVAHGVFSTEPPSQNNPVASAHDMPLFPLVTAGFIKVTGSLSTAVYMMGFVNIVLMACSAFLFISLISTPFFMCSPAGKIIGLSLFLFMPETIPYSLFCMPDTMAVFFVVLALWSFSRAFSRRAWLFVSAVSWGLAVLSKPICLPLALCFLTVGSFRMNTVRRRRQFALAVGCLIILAGILTPWIIRNKNTFGIASLTSITGTNLYFYNVKGMVNSWPVAKQEKVQKELQCFEQTLVGVDPIIRSKRCLVFAKKKITQHWMDYLIYTIKTHPRLYFGTGTVVLFRYLGLKGPYTALRARVGNFKNEPLQRISPSSRDIFLAWFVQGFSLAVLFVGYVAVIGGGIRILKIGSEYPAIWLLSVLALVVMAVIIGPVVSTRYRFLMIPFFAILAAGNGLVPLERRLSQDTSV